MLLFFRVTFEGRNARGIVVLLSFVSRPLLYSRYVADSGLYMKYYDSNSATCLLLVRKCGDISFLARVVTLCKCIVNFSFNFSISQLMIK